MNRYRFTGQLAPWHFAFLAVTLVYGLYLRQNSAAAGLGLRPTNAWDHIITFIVDPYYISYFLVPVWLFSSCSVVHRHFGVPSLIRRGSYVSWLRSSVMTALQRAAILVLIWLVSALATSAGLPRARGWSAASTVTAPANQVLSIVSNQGLEPIPVLLLQMLLLCLTLLALHSVIATICLLWQRSSTTYLVGAVLFLGQIVSFRRPIEVAPFLDVANFLLLHRAFEAYAPVWLVFVPVTAIVTFCFMAARGRDGRLRWRRVRISPSLLLYSALCATGVFYALVFQLGGGVRDASDLLLAAFFGVSASGFEWTLYMYQSIVFLGFAYLFLLSLDNELNGRIYYVALRYGSGYRWLKHLLLPYASRALLLLIALFATASLTSLAASNIENKSASPFGPIERGWIMYQFFVNGSLQILCYVLIVFVVAWLSGRPTAGLFALGGLLVAGLPSINKALVLPSALNSLGYVSLGADELLRITAVLGVYTMLLLLAALYLVRTPKLFFSERK